LQNSNNKNKNNNNNHNNNNNNNNDSEKKCGKHTHRKNSLQRDEEEGLILSKATVEVTVDSSI